MTFSRAGAAVRLLPGLLAALLVLVVGEPLTQAAPTVASTFEEGLASWYGRKFHGRKTASGEVFDKDGLTAAHRTLPFGTLVLVTNLDNGRHLRVRVNDRGPFIQGRILDCSEGAAAALDFQRAGITHVRLELLGELPSADDPRLTRKERKRLRAALDRAARRGREVVVDEGLLTPVQPLVGPFAVQVGAFADAANAARFVRNFAGRVVPARVVTLPDGLHRVRLGPCATREAAERLVATLRDEGQTAFVVRDDQP